MQFKCRSPRERFRRLCVETLESRQLLAADLEVAAFLTPQQAAIGQPIGDLIHLEVRNNGPDPVPPNVDVPIGFYVSSDDTITTGDQLLLGGREFLTNGLAPGESRVIPLASVASISPNVSTGLQFIGVLVDEFNIVAEMDEANNTAVHPIDVLPVRASLSLGEGRDMAWSDALQQQLLVPVSPDLPLTSAADAFYSELVAGDPTLDGFGLVEVQLTPDFLVSDDVETHQSLVISWLDFLNGPQPRGGGEALGVGAWDVDVRGADMSETWIDFSVLARDSVANLSVEIVDIDDDSRGWFESRPDPGWMERRLDPADVSLQGFDSVFSDPLFDLEHVAKIRLTASWAGETLVEGIDPATGLNNPWAAWNHLTVRPQVASIEGDYNGNGRVEQGDLDLVLLHWGAPTPPIPADWVNDLPVGRIDQAELDKVLLNWGNSAPAQTASAHPMALASGDASPDAARFKRVPNDSRAGSRSVSLVGGNELPLSVPPSRIARAASHDMVLDLWDKYPFS